jgi:hypothetical protein
MLLELFEVTLREGFMTRLWINSKHIRILCLVCILLMGVGSGRSQTSKDEEVDRFAKAYRTAKTDLERRTLCLEAIDAGVIARGHNVAVVDRIFGTHYAKKLPSGVEFETGTVDFHPQPVPQETGDRYSAHDFVGWFLAFRFGSDGSLEDYYLTNLHK